MDDGFQAFESGLVATQRLGQSCAVHGPVHDHAGEGLTQGFDRRPATPIEAMHGGVGVPQQGAFVGEHPPRRRLAHADRAGQAEDDHTTSPR
ncbi:hypothetical protein D3C81_1559040 [compost metagenome]